MVCICVCVSAVYIVLLWKALSLVSPFISSLITVPTGKAAQKSLSNANALTLLAHNTHRLAVSHYSFTVYLPRLRLPAPNTHNLFFWLFPRETSGQLIFSSTHRLINTTPHYSGLTQNNPSKVVRHVTIEAAFSSDSLVWTRSPLYSSLFHLFSLSSSLEATNWSDALRGKRQNTVNMQTGCQSRAILKPGGHLAGRGLSSNRQFV